MLANHDRLDKMLHVAEYTDAACGSLNLRTGQAEYCGYDCPTMIGLIMTQQNPAQPSNRPPDGLRYAPFDAARDMQG